MTVSRSRIMEILQQRQAATVGELSHTLGVTAANIRHHLAVLVEQGVVTVGGQKASGKRGRPANVYCLSRQSRRHNLDGLASALLTELLAGGNQQSQTQALDKLAERLAGEQIPPTGSLTSRLYRAMPVLERLAYQARWEAHAPAPQVILGHCPYRSLVDAHPELCQLDHQLLANLLHAPVTQKEKLAHDSRGLTYCRFSVNE